MAFPVFYSSLEVFTSVPPGPGVGFLLASGFLLINGYQRVIKPIKAGKKNNAAIIHVAMPADMIIPRLRMPRCCARIKLPNPEIAVKPDTRTALPVLLDKMPGVPSSA